MLVRRRKSWSYLSWKNVSRTLWNIPLTIFIFFWYWNVFFFTSSCVCFLSSFGCGLYINLNLPMGESGLGVLVSIVTYLIKSCWFLKLLGYGQIAYRVWFHVCFIEVKVSIKVSNTTTWSLEYSKERCNHTRYGGKCVNFTFVFTWGFFF